MRIRRLIPLALLAVGTLAGAASAQYQRPSKQDVTKPEADAALLKSRSEAGVSEKVGNDLDPSLTFTDSDGRPVTLGEVFARGKPVVLQMAYYRCPALCGEVMNGMAAAMKTLGNEYTIGEDFEVVTLSFDSREPATLAKDNKDATIDNLTRGDNGITPGDVRQGWHFWVGDDANITALAEDVGFRFAWIEEAQEYSHPGVIVLLTPDGVVGRYLHGTTYDPQTLRLSLVEASQGTLSPSLHDAFIYYCFAYDPTTGKYTATAMTVMKIGGAVTVLTLACVIGFLIVAERHGKLRRRPAGAFVDGDHNR